MYLIDIFHRLESLTLLPGRHEDTDTLMKDPAVKVRIYFPTSINVQNNIFIRG